MIDSARSNLEYLGQLVTNSELELISADYAHNIRKHLWPEVHQKVMIVLDHKHNNPNEGDEFEQMVMPLKWQ